MRHLRYLFAVAVLLMATVTRAQYNPQTPDEPGAQPWLLTLRAVPADGGYFSHNQQSGHAAGEEFTLRAYSHSYFRFVHWEDEQGHVLGTDPSLPFTMPAHHVTLTARFAYSPDMPDEPGQASIRRHLYLKTSPEGAGWFNLSGSNDVVAGESLHLHAYGNTNYVFRSWMQEETVVSTSAAFDFVMPDRDVTLTASFDYDYQPNTPDEPGEAQREYINIYGMRVGAVAGQTVSYPLYLENTREGVTGFQVDVLVPHGFTLDGQAAALTDRAGHHALKAEQTGDGEAWRFTVSGAQPIDGVDGKVLLLPIHVPDTATIGHVFTISLTNGLVFKADGGQQDIRVRSGSLQIQRSADEQPDSPDYVVTDVQTTTTDVLPSGSISLSWQIKNQGNVAGMGGWTERVYLVAADGRRVSIGTTTYDAAELKPGATVSRHATMVLAQLPGMDGRADLAVAVIPSISAGELANFSTNNMAQTQGQPVNVGKRLVLTVPATPQQEGETTSLRCQLARSGNWTQTETFQLTKLAGDERISMPQTVTIARDQAAAYFILSLANDNVCNTDSVVSWRIEGNGYEPVEGTVIIRDDERPPLRLTASTAEVTEGETFQLTVQLDRPATQPVVLRLSAEHPQRFSFPAEMVIAAGQSSQTADIIATDNNEIEPQQSTSFRITSNLYAAAECVILLNDNDMPTLSFKLSPTDVSEADGQNAMFGIISRSDKLDSRLTLQLSDDSDGLLSYDSKTIVMESGAKNVYFQIGVADNSLVDGNHTVTVTAAVYSVSCHCQMNEEGAGLLSATVTVMDDDGPSLSMKPAATAMLEGSQSNRFIVARNTLPDKEVLVTISSDKDEILEYNHTLIIPAGAPSADLLVGVKNNDMPDDSNIVTFKAESDGYAAGTCWTLITDQTKPDAVIALRADKETVEAEDTVGLTLVVKNLGNAPLNSRTPIEIVFSGRQTPAEIIVGQRLLPGDSTVIDYNYGLPSATGIQTFEAVVNRAALVEELLFSNNSSYKVPVLVLPPFSATAQADKKRYNQGDSIVITGIATGSKGQNAKAEVYVINEGSRQRINTNTDAEGRFTAVYHPQPSQVGHFTIGACYPGQDVNDEMDAFDVMGLVPLQRFTTCEMGLTDTYTGTIVLSNPCAFRQNGITVSQKGESSNCDFNFSTPKFIDSGAKAEITFTVKSHELSEGTEWQRMPVEITTTEGANLSYMIYYYVHPLKAQLQASETDIVTTMTIGASREYPITIRNTGRTETGQITLSLPAWIETSTPRVMASLQQGDSTTVMLRLMPFDGMKVNVPVAGYFGINCKNGDGVRVNYSITPVSEATGTVAVDVIDEYTYYTQQAPHVYNARVRLMNPATQQVVAEGTTDFSGVYSVELPEGYYALSVEADKHHGYVGHVLVNPGTNSNEEVFISYDAITYDWNVVETEVEDEYEMETIVKFETRVPKPVVTISLPRERPQPYSIVPITLTNHGLVHALDVSAWFTTNDSYRLEPLNDTWLDTLGAQQSYTIYAKLVPTQQEEAGARPLKVTGGSDCLSLGANSRNKQPCDKYPDYDYAQDNVSWGNCGGFHMAGGNSGHNSQGSDPGSPTGSGQGTNVDNYVFSEEVGSDPSRFCGDGPQPTVDLPVMDSGLPGEISCDEPDKLKLIYHLVPVSGTPYILKGVAADGMSAVKIALDPKSFIPSYECLDCQPTMWTLTASDENMADKGKLSPNGWEAVYTAPADYPANVGSVTHVKATIHYICNNFPGSEDIFIDIIRPPVVFIHGLGDSGLNCWTDMYLHIAHSDLYKNGINYIVDYESTNTSTFMENVGNVADGIFQAQERAINKGYMATKCDLVCHSMGGILARLFVERGGRKEDVNRIITINTPHAGSELGDMVAAHPWVCQPLAKLKYGKENIQAVYDLGVESDETSLLVNVAGHFDIPVFALATENDAYSKIITGGEVAMDAIEMAMAAAAAASGFNAAFNPNPTTKVFATIVSAILSLAVCETRHLLLDDYAQLGPGDLVVSSESQIGGCKANHIIKHGPWHCASTTNDDVKQWVEDLLKQPATSSTFSRDWFTPKKRHFEHSLGKILFDRIVSLGAGTLWKFFGKEAGKAVQLMVRSASHARGQSAASSQERVLSVQLTLPDDVEATSMVCLNGVPATLLTERTDEYVIPATFSGEVQLITLLKDSEGVLYYDHETYTVDQPLATPVSIEAEEVTVIAGKTEPLHLTCTWDDGSQTRVIADTMELADRRIASYDKGLVKGLSSGTATATVSFHGLTCSTNVTVYRTTGDLLDSLENPDEPDNSDAVCTTVTLSFKQKNVMTRQAFRGTLKINNGNPETALRDMKLHLEVRNPQGQLATEHEFQINAESLEGFEGDLALDAGWTLAAGATGTVTILFIPTKYAAQTEPVDYAFGGYFSFTDPTTGHTVSLPLNPVTLTVSPTPEMDLTYFMQRDIYGDDPLTETVEPIVPAEFALLVNNKGYGDATNMKLTTKQPEIIDNKKGLAINFEIVSSQLNGEDRDLAMGGSIVNDFGTIAAHSQAYAQWWLTSTLLGHFISYDVTATHLTSYGNEDLSLLGDVSIHELIHGFTPEDGGRAFLVNDVPDVNDMPDEVYFTDGTQRSVAKAAHAEIELLSATDYRLTLTPSAAGWNYGAMADPTGGELLLQSVTRMSDGATLPTDNAWQTPVTMRDGRDPVHESRLHFVFNALHGVQTWLLNFTQRPEETAIDDICQDANGAGRLLLAPLPLSSWMYVSGPFKEINRIEVYDMRGIRCLTAKGILPTQGVFVGSLPKGVYQVRVFTNRGTFTQKVMKR